MKQIIILGSNSFAGSSFVDYCLEKNLKVIGISRSSEKSQYELKYKNNKKLKKFRFCKIDINKDLDKLKKIIKKNSTIIDFAGQGMVSESWKNPEHWFQTNVQAKIKLIELLKVIKIQKYVRISTPEVYGSFKKKLTENNRHNPNTPYALTHSTIDQFLTLQKKYYNFPCIILRFSNFYGEYQPLYRIIPKTIISILKKKKLELHGNGSSLRSFIYTKDFCNAIYLALYSKKTKNFIFNISSNEILSIKKLIKLICKKMNYNFNNLIRKTSDRVGKDKIYFMNSSKAKSILRWQNDTNLSNGIDKTIIWMQKNFKKIKLLKTNYMHKK
jgi:dTDP-glucose 4,6-dehydratase